jgi:hypothetical protein
MWTGRAECYGVTPVVAVVPLLNQILSILNKRTLLIRLSYQLQIQVHRGQLRVQVQRQMSDRRGQQNVKLCRHRSVTGTSTQAEVTSKL